MKKILLILSIFFLQLQASAFEDYIIMSDFKIEKAYSNNNNIVEITPFYTIDNKKNTLILHSKNSGKTTVVFETEKSKILMDVIVDEDKTTLSEIDGMQAFVLDVIDEPLKPVLREGK